MQPTIPAGQSAKLKALQKTGTVVAVFTMKPYSPLTFDRFEVFKTPAQAEHRVLQLNTQGNHQARVVE